MVEREFPAVRLLRRDNIGFSAANNLVLRESDADFVLLLNPDTEVYAGTLDAALARLRSDRRIGMVGCKLVTESGALDHACKRSFPTPAERPGPLHRTRPLPGMWPGRSASTAQPTSTTTKLGEVDAINGAFMLCRAEAVREVGLLDEGYWLYMEDLDWCARFWRAGWKIFYEPAWGGPTRQGRLQRPAAVDRGRRSLSTAAWAASTAASTRPGAQSAPQRRGLCGDRRQARRQPGDHRREGPR